MIKIPPCDLPMVPFVPMVQLAAENVQGFLVTIGKNGTNSTIGRFADFTIGRTPNVAHIRHAMPKWTISHRRLPPTKIWTILECKIHPKILQVGIPENRDGQTPSLVAPLDRGVAGLSS